MPRREGLVSASYVLRKLPPKGHAHLTYIRMLMMFIVSLRVPNDVLWIDLRLREDYVLVVELRAWSSP